MKLLLLLILCGAILIMPNTSTYNGNVHDVSADLNYSNTVEAINTADKITVISNGTETSYEKNNSVFNAVLETFNQGTVSSHMMPALGVSLDNEVKQAKKVGIWLEFNFNKTTSVEGMFFDGLLIEVNPNHGGINLFRKNNGQYEGRCLYLSNVDLNKLYNLLITL